MCTKFDIYVFIKKKRFFASNITKRLLPGPRRGGSAGTPTRGPENQEGACESMKGPIDILFWVFIFFCWYVQLCLLDLKFSDLREVSACLRGPKAVMFRLAKFLLEALAIYLLARTNKS